MVVLLELHSLVDGDGGVVLDLDILVDVGLHRLHHLRQPLLLDPERAVLDDYVVGDASCHALEVLVLHS